MVFLKKYVLTAIVVGAASLISFAPSSALAQSGGTQVSPAPTDKGAPVTQSTWFGGLLRTIGISPAGIPGTTRVITPSGSQPSTSSSGVGTFFTGIFHSAGSMIHGAVDASTGGSQSAQQAKSAPTTGQQSFQSIVSGNSYVSAPSAKEVPASTNTGTDLFGAVSNVAQSAADTGVNVIHSVAQAGSSVIRTVVEAVTGTNTAPPPEPIDDNAPPGTYPPGGAYGQTPEPSSSSENKPANTSKPPPTVPTGPKNVPAVNVNPASPPPSPKPSATYTGNGNTSVGNVIEVHIGPLSTGASTANTGSCNSGDQCADDIIDTGGAGNPNNGAGENNKGMNQN